MGKFCSNCGSPLNGKFCSNCGAKSEINSANGLSEEANRYINQKIASKQNHNGYRIAVGVIMIILGALILIGLFNESTILEHESLEYDMGLGLLLPSIAVLIGGILSIISVNDNNLLLPSGICYIAAAVYNFFGIRDISLLFILCCVFAPINFAYYSSVKNKKE